MKRDKSDVLRHMGKMWICPSAIYFVMFCILTYPLILPFRTHFFADTFDGLQNAWNLWWVDKAVTDLHRAPWYTTYLHYPKGTSLLGHTLKTVDISFRSPDGEAAVGGL